MKIKQDKVEVADIVVYKTKDYSLFKKIKGNRSLNAKHQFNLMKSLMRNNMLSKLPIVVNEKMEVIDGQHRLEYCKNNDETVYFTVIEGANLTDIQLLNTYSKPWKIEDYVNSYIVLGNPAYKYLHEISTAYKAPYLFVASLLNYGTAKTVTDRERVGKVIRTGEFVITDKEYAIKILDLINTLREYADVDCFRNRNFMSAVRILHKSPNFDLDKMLEKLKESKAIIRVQGNTKGYMRQFEEIYSFKNKSIVSFMSYAQKRQYVGR